MSIIIVIIIIIIVIIKFVQATTVSEQCSPVGCCFSHVSSLADRLVSASQKRCQALLPRRLDAWERALLICGTRSDAL